MHLLLTTIRLSNIQSTFGTIQALLHNLSRYPSDRDNIYNTLKVLPLPPSFPPSFSSSPYIWFAYIYWYLFCHQVPCTETQRFCRIFDWTFTENRLEVCTSRAEREWPPLHREIDSSLQCINPQWEIIVLPPKAHRKALPLFIGQVSPVFPKQATIRPRKRKQTISAVLHWWRRAANSWSPEWKF